MASTAAAKAAGGVVSISKKQTLQSTGVWEVFRRLVAIDPNRSNGIPLNPYYRFPSPGAVSPLAYTDPVTIPAADIANNPYWKRDIRRAYPRTSVLAQHDAVALLTVGSAGSPKTRIIGNAGSTKMMQVLQDASSDASGGLSGHIEREGVDVCTDSIFVNNLPPLPSGQYLASGGWDVYEYKLKDEQPYSEDLPCRSFQ